MKIRFGARALDTDERVLLRGGQPVHLTPKAFQLLGFLVEVRPRAVPKSELQEKLWPATFVSVASPPTVVKEARRAIGDDERESVRHVFGDAVAELIEIAIAGEVLERKDENRMRALSSLVGNARVARFPRPVLDLWGCSSVWESA